MVDVTLCGSESNRGFGITLAIRYKLHCSTHLQAQYLYESEISTGPILQRMYPPLESIVTDGVSAEDNAIGYVDQSVRQFVSIF